MGCGASNNTPRVQVPTLKKKPALPPIESQSKKKSPSAKSDGSNDSGIEDTEPIKKIPSSSKIPAPTDNLYIEHHQKSRLGYGETFEITSSQKPGALAPLRNVPRFLAANKQTPTVDSDLQAKLAAKQERASRKRQEIEEARRQASSRIGHRTSTKPALQPITTAEPLSTTFKHDERQQQLSMLRDQLRRSSSNSLYEPMHTPRTPRADSVTSGTTDIANTIPRRGGVVIGATTASNFKPVYD
ncbi:unnamed protein product [Rotaria sordida]|uniref:Uncharacterized protein n=1 Tax=Rotaria sordida TaxID=392033 RepID=A0A813PI71_9BILA|nr:unnamed protein product [Rotaria sordida]CAF0803512.1 unnamed protein product [Rotaria sordida]CAF3680322.1 unnamed protein product [Rotaria sordida]CAF3709014.1 unnamed protein product [Rotaria sordida]